jgi:hypothetical protein
MGTVRVGSSDVVVGHGEANGHGDVSGKGETPGIGVATHGAEIAADPGPAVGVADVASVPRNDVVRGPLAVVVGPSVAIAPNGADPLPEQPATRQTATAAGPDARDDREVEGAASSVGSRLIGDWTVRAEHGLIGRVATRSVASIRGPSGLGAKRQIVWRPASTVDLERMRFR